MLWRSAVLTCGTLGLVGCSLIHPSSDYLQGSTELAGTTAATSGGSGGATGGGGDGGAGPGSTTTAGGVGGAGTGGTGEGGAGPAAIGRMYLLGGFRVAGDKVLSGAKTLPAVTSSASVFADGSLGPWRDEASLFAGGIYRAIHEQGQLRAFGVVQDLGGKPGFADSTIGPDGVLGPWSTAAAPLASGVVDDLPMFAWDGSSGFSASFNPDRTNTFYRSRRENGTAITAAIPGTFATARNVATGIRFEDKLLFVGGSNFVGNSTVTTPTVEVGVVPSDPTAEVVFGNALPIVRNDQMPHNMRSPGVCADAQRIYLVGGLTGTAGTTKSSRVFASTEDVGGNLVSFDQRGDMIAQLSSPACVVVGDRLYVLGGIDSEDKAVPIVRWSKIGADGALDANWTIVDTAPMPFARYRHEVVFVPD